MPVVPAFCDTCGTVFGSGVFVENSREIGFYSVRAGPCPSCGGSGHVPDGLYNFIGETMELLRGPSATVVDLRRLAALLERARDEQAAPDEVREAIARETPGLTKLADLLPRTRSELYGFLAVLLAVLSIIIALKGTSNESVEVDVDVHVPRIIDQITTPTPVPSPTQPEVATAKVGRNEPCPCGSGQKFKRCHGANI